MLRRAFIVSALLALAGCGGKSKGTQLNPGAKVAIVLRDGARLTKETSQHHSHGAVLGFFSSARGIELARNQSPRQMKATLVHEAMHLLYYKSKGNAMVGHLIGETLRDLNGDGFRTGWDSHAYWTPRA